MFFVIKILIIVIIVVNINFVVKYMVEFNENKWDIEFLWNWKIERNIRCFIRSILNGCFL